MSDAIEQFSQDGQIEKFGMSNALDDQMAANFIGRGEQMAQLVVATLTETPYTPHLAGQKFGVEISNVYGEGSSDTVVDAREALAEALAATTEGMKTGALLWGFKTKYGKIADDLEPSRREGKRNLATFEEAFVTRARLMGIEIPDPEVGRQIIRFAPKKLAGLKLTTNEPRWAGDSVTNDMVTTDGRMVGFRTTKRNSLTGAYYPASMPTEASMRGGHAPHSHIVTDIRDRVIELRTKKTVRP